MEKFNNNHNSNEFMHKGLLRLEDFRELNEEEYKQELFEWICYVAENIFYFGGRGLTREEANHCSFKPGTSDKLLFKIMVEKYFNWVPQENRNNVDIPLQAVNLLKIGYYPSYERWDKKQQEEAR